jgi:DNA-binding MarR family transcriptional regulator
MSAPAADRDELLAAFLVEVRRVGSLLLLLSQRGAEQMGINLTDLNCLNILSLTGSMTAGQLAQATGLTTASVTGLVDRLEHAGYVRRGRDPSDRRRVVIEYVAERVHAVAAPVFGQTARAWATTAAPYDKDELAFILDFYQRTAGLLEQELNRLRNPRAAGGADQDSDGVNGASGSTSGTRGASAGKAAGGS